MKVKTLWDKLLVKTQTGEKKTPGGIVVPGGYADDEDVQLGEVIVAGDGVWQETATGLTLRPLGVKPGDVVAYKKDFGVECMVDGQKHRVITENQILYVVAEP